MIDSKLVAALDNPEESGRRHAAREIGESDDPEACGVLIAHLHKERSRAVKDALLWGILNTRRSSSMESIVGLLRDEDPFVRAEAAAMLQRAGEDATECLIQVLGGGDRDLRKFSVDILSQASSGVPDSFYLTALRDDDINVVISAVENIGLGHRTAFAEPVLSIALGPSHPMAVCACLEALTLIGTRPMLDALRVKFPDAAEAPGIYLQPFLKLIGGVAGPESIDEVCRTIARKGPAVHATAIDAIAKITSRHAVAQLNEFCEDVLCGLLQSELDGVVRFHLVRLLGHFTASGRVALSVLPFVHDPDRALGQAAVESLANSSETAVRRALRSLPATESDPESGNSFEELLGRRSRWNSPPNNSPS